jgi:hypothetical protein
MLGRKSITVAPPREPHPGTPHNHPQPLPLSGVRVEPGPQDLVKANCSFYAILLSKTTKSGHSSKFSFLLLILFSETRSHYVGQTGLKLWASFLREFFLFLKGPFYRFSSLLRSLSFVMKFLTMDVPQDGGKTYFRE